MLGRLAGVDRAAEDLPFAWLHRRTFVRGGETLLRCNRPTAAMPAWLPAVSSSIFSGRFRPARSPKKRGPFQAVPVMLHAMAERLAYCLLYTSDAADDLTRVALGGRG